MLEIFYDTVIFYFNVSQCPWHAYILSYIY